jgi:D-serine deaminase-like pyridoxal phosphate-dependent protein
MNPPPAEIGAPVAEVETPALLIDLNAFDRNIAKMAEFARTAGVRVRPHAKTHKSTAIALRQIALGAVGQCVQKVGEAEVLVRGGVKDVLVSNQVVGERKLRRLAALANEATIALCFDAPEQVDAAARVARDFGVTLGGLVEIEVGMERCGVAPGRCGSARTPRRRCTEPEIYGVAGLPRPRAAHDGAPGTRAGDRVRRRCGARDVGGAGRGKSSL